MIERQIAPDVIVRGNVVFSERTDLEFLLSLLKLCALPTISSGDVAINIVNIFV